MRAVIAKNAGLSVGDLYKAKSSAELYGMTLQRPGEVFAGVAFYPAAGARADPRVAPGVPAGMPVPFVVLYNETLPHTDESNLRFEAVSFHVERAVAEELAGADRDRLPLFTGSRYPQLWKMRKFDAMGLLSPFILYSPSMFNFVLLLYHVAHESEARLRTSLRAAGLSDVAYWASYYIYNVAFVLVGTLLTVALGCAFQFAFFLRASIAAVLLTFFSFGIAMTPLAVSLGMVLKTTHTAVNTGIGVFLLGMLMQIMATNPWLMAKFYSPNFPGAITQALHLWPPFNFAKMVIDIAAKTPETDVWVRHATFFEWHNMFESTPLANGVTYPAPIASLYWQLIDTAIFFALSLVLYVVVPSESGLLGRALARLRAPRRPADDDERRLLSRANEVNGDQDESDVKAEQEAARQDDGQGVAVGIRDLTVAYSCPSAVPCRGRDFVAVNGLGLTIRENEILALLGHNGCGKSSTMKVLSCESPPTAGDAIVFGHSALREPEVVRGMIGVCPQDDVLWPDLTAREHLEIIGRLKGVAADKLAEEIETRLKDVALWEVADRAAGTFSGGMKRRLSVAISCVGDPKLLLLDEPTTGLDPVSRRQMWTSLQRLRTGRAVLLTTHSMEEAEALGDRIAIMRRGCLQCVGTAFELKARHGAGYALHVIARQGSEARAKELVAKSLPAAAVVTSMGTSIKYGVPCESVRDLSALLVEMQRELRGPAGHEFPISEWGVSQTTLEEVFLKLKTSEYELPFVSCTKEPWVSHRPFRFKMNDDPDWLGCGWNAADSATRTAAGILITIYGIASVIVIVKVSLFWTYLFPVLTVLFGGFGIVSVGVRDSNRIADSRSWCHEVHSLWSGLDCAYGPLIVVALLDFLAAVAPSTMVSRRTLLVLMWVAFSFAVGASLAATALGLTQIKSRTETKHGSHLVGKDPCSVDPLSTHIPSKFRINNDPDWLGCGWSASDSARRTSAGILMTLYGVGAVVLLPVLMVVAGGVGFFAVGVRDGSHVNHSRTWCNNGLAGIAWSPSQPSIHCDYALHIVVALLDFVAAVAWVALGVDIFFVLRCRQQGSGDAAPKAQAPSQSALIDGAQPMSMTEPPATQMHDFVSDSRAATAASTEDKDLEAMFSKPVTPPAN
eukprot:m51a1_g1144 hypothetical protein (1128) ;mRNA; r:261719-266744